MTAGWQELTVALDEARTQLLAVAPDPAVATEAEAYLTRVVTAGLDNAVLGHWLGDSGLYRAVPVAGGPNPDYILLHAPIDPTRRLRLEGHLKASERIGVGLYAHATTGAIQLQGYVAFDKETVDADGSFGLDIVPQGEASDEETGVLCAPAETQVLLIRVLHRDTAAAPARLRLTGGAAKPGLALATGSNDGALAFVARGLGRTVKEYLRWTLALQQQPNGIAPPPPELAASVNAEPETRYFLGNFALAEGEWLEVEMPAALRGYWSLHAYNFWWEHLQTPGVHDRNAVADADGRVRIAIGPALPADARNRIDTLARRHGMLICRVMSDSATPVATVRS